MKSLVMQVVLIGSLSACGSGGPGSSAGAGSAGGPASFQPSPPPAAWADEGCAFCHGADGAGGDAAPDLRCSSYERLDGTVRTAGTPHTGGSFPTLSDQELQDMVAFLRTADCPGDAPPGAGVPASHTESEDGVLHHPDYERNPATCTACHGANLEGSAFAPSCASCHGSDGFDDDDDEGDDDDDDDDESESD